MSDASEENASLQQALTGGALQLIGEYRFYFDEERWEWSEEVQRLHGYEPGTVTPTTELVLSHKHPDDYAQVAATLDDVRRTHKPFSTPSVTDAVAEFRENRAAIEQAKGVLMYVYRITADAAFELLAWRSQESQVKLRALAQQVVADIQSVKYDEDSQRSRERFDQLFLTAHNRVEARASQ
jgi:hypothetical protein